MTLGNYISYLRAMRGGISPQDVAEQTGIDRYTLWELEVKHRQVGDDDMLHKLSEFFGVSYDDLATRREHFGKRFTSFLWRRLNDHEPAWFVVRFGERVEGRVRWANMLSFALDIEDRPDPLVVLRHAVDDWGLLRQTQTAQEAASELAAAEDFPDIGEEPPPLPVAATAQDIPEGANHRGADAPASEEHDVSTPEARPDANQTSDGQSLAELDAGGDVHAQAEAPNDVAEAPAPEQPTTPSGTDGATVDAG